MKSLSSRVVVIHIDIYGYKVFWFMSSSFSIVFLSYRSMNEKSLFSSNIILNFLPACGVFQYLTKLSSLKYLSQFPNTVEFLFSWCWYFRNSDTLAVEENILKSGSPPKLSARVPPHWLLWYLLTPCVPLHQLQLWKLTIHNFPFLQHPW